MTSASPPQDALAEIDATHLVVREAFRRRDLPSYAACFAPDLEFRGANGRVMSRDALTHDVQRQFDRLVAFDSKFDRCDATLAGHDLIETGTQTAWIALRIFAVFAVRWKVERRGRYVWTRTRSGWQLRQVLIEHERISRDGFGLASRVGPA
jgi:ketosteroid isomerase-like protein